MEYFGGIMEYTKLRNLNRGYMKLEVWHKGIELYEAIWQITRDMKMGFKLKTQLLDSSLSVSSNIAEGYSRRSIREYIQYLYVSLGSLSETMTRIVGLKVTGEISENQFHAIDKLHYEVENKAIRLVESLQRKKGLNTWNDQIP